MISADFGTLNELVFRSCLIQGPLDLTGRSSVASNPQGMSKGAEDDKSFNRVPIWNGKPEDFSHYVQEIRWFFAATKSTDRPYAAARLIRRMLDSEYTALKTLMYKLDPSDFRDEDGIGKLIAFLENSPMNRQPIPDAGAKLSQYYRKLGRKNGESIPQFLVREDHAHDGMWRALQRLLREKALDFTKYDVSETELRIFCGMGDQSYYYENEMNAEEDDLDEDDQGSRHSGTTINPNRSGKGSSSTSTRPEPKRKDLIERLMDKGLIPLAALDIIRGWMILEMTSSTDTDKALVKAATQNKLGYEAIRAALLSMHEDRDRFPRHGDKGRGRHHALQWSEDWQQSYDMQEDEYDQYQSEMWNPDYGEQGWQDGFYGQEEEWQPGHDEPAEDEPTEQEDNPESSAMLAQLEEESHGLQAMLAENQRNLQQARQAVASAKKDRGWQHPTAHAGGKHKPTSTFMKGKGGKAKGKNFSSPSSPNSPILWTSKGGQKGQFRRPHFSQKGFQGGKSAHKNWYNEMYESGMLTLEVDPGSYDMNMHEVDGLKPAESDQVFQSMHMQQTKSSMKKTQTPSLAVSSNSSSQGSRPRSIEAGGTRGVIDTGATVSAGGRSAVQEMVTGLAKVRPDLEVTIMQGDRPYFRYGSGQWGRALFRVQLKFGNIVLQIYSLPSENVPVLVGMRELKQLQVILNCETSFAVIAGEPRVLQLTSKGHALLDLAADIPLAPVPSRHVRFVDAEFHDLAMLNADIQTEEIQTDEIETDESEYRRQDFDLFGFEPVDQSWDEKRCCQHLGISDKMWTFLASPSAQRFKSLSQDRVESSHPPSSQVIHGSQFGDQGHAEDRNQRGVGRTEVRSRSFQSERWIPIPSKPQVKIQNPHPEEDRVRRVQEDDTNIRFGSPYVGDSMAMPGQSSDHLRQQSLWPLGGLSGVRDADGIYSSSWVPSKQLQVRSRTECDRSLGAIEEQRMDQRQFGTHYGQEHDQAGECGEGCHQAQGQPGIISDQEEQATFVGGRGSGSIGRFVRTYGGQDQDPGQGEGEGISTSVRDEVWHESQTCELSSHQRTSLQQCVKENWAAFDAARALRDLRESEHVWEICCSPNSRLTAEARRQDMKATRWNYESGFDLGCPRKVDDMIRDIPRSKPTRLWASPRCTAVTSIQNINQRTEQQRMDLRRKRLKTIREIKQLLRIFKAAYCRKPGQVHLYMEWPKSAVFGWRMREWQELQQWLWTHFQQKMFWVEIHGCMFGMKDGEGVHINKPWYILTTDENFFLNGQAKCDGSHSHRPVVGMGTDAVHNTAFYPQAMVKRIVQIWKKEWHHDRQSDIIKNAFTIHTQEIFQNHWDSECEQFSTQNDLMPVQEEQQPSDSEDILQDKTSKQGPENVDDYEVSPDTRERARIMLHKLHRAAGHPTNRNLAKLCRDRQLPKWIVKEALELKCQACKDTERGQQLIQHRSLGDRAMPWQMIAMDGFELHFPAKNVKARYIIFACMAMHYVSVACTWIGSMTSAGTDNGMRVIQAFCDTWLLHRPRPQWILMDSQTSFCQGVFPEFLSTIGIGSAVTAVEAHWQNGVAEALIGTMKRTMRRIRNADTSLSPVSVGVLAAYAQNHTDKIHGYTPIQWAYGAQPNFWPDLLDPAEINKDQIFGHQTFADLQQNRDMAQQVCIEERARNTMSRLLNASSRPALKFEVGDHVCIWRTATLKSRKKTDVYNPEPRYVGPGRVIMLEPPVFPSNRITVVWVLLGTTVYRCAPEQLRLATKTETMTEALRGTRLMTFPKEDLMKRLGKYVDVTKEANDVPDLRGTIGQEEASPETEHAEEWQERLERGEKRLIEDESAENKKRRFVEEQKRKWNQLVSVNKNRRLEGLAPISQLSDLAQASQSSSSHSSSQHLSQFSSTVHAAEVFRLDDDHGVREEVSPDIKTEQDMLHVFACMDPKVREEVFVQLDGADKYQKETQQLLLKVEQETHREEALLSFLHSERLKGTDSQSAWTIEFDIEHSDAFVANNMLYVKKVLESKGTEVKYERLSEIQQELMDEAKAREVSEVIQSMALRKIQSHEEYVDAHQHPERHIPMRWVLTWKPLYPPEKPQGSGPHVVTPSGDQKAKARVVLIGFRHPELVEKDDFTGRPLLQTSSPTISRLGRHMLLQSMAFDQHTMECADAKSAFLQADNNEESRRLWTKAVPEISAAMGVKSGELLRVVGAIYGLTNAPRIFWRDASLKLKQIGAIQNPVDRCVWLFKNSKGNVCGRIGSQVDDFLFGGDINDPEWIQIREKLKTMYRWSPWQKGEFQFSGCKLTQTMTFSIHVSQEDFCNSLRPVEIHNGGARADSDPLTAQETSQARALLMKGQWRALQSAPQFCARIGLASSAVSKPTVGLLKEANNIVKDMRKTAKEDIVFHSFNYFRKKGQQLRYTDLVFISWGDASHKNRPNNFSTGGLVIGASTPEILSGKETPVSLLDWRSWKLRRVAAGSNGSEGQAVCEAEDKGWKARLLWAMMYGNILNRSNADFLTSLVLSFLVMDSRGVYDALTGTETPGLSMENSKSSVDILSTSQGLEEHMNSHPAWVPGNLNLADALTKHSAEAWKTMVMYHAKKSWILKFNDEFVSARKQTKMRKQKQQECQNVFPDEWFEDPFEIRFGTDLIR